MGEHKFSDKDYVMTPECAHLLVAARRVHDQTGCGVVVEGRGNSGKSTLMQLYRQIYHQNTFYLRVSGKQTNSWSTKIDNTLQRHGLNLLGARINYKETMIMVEDVHMASTEALTPLQLMLNYQKWSSSTYQSLTNIKFLLTSKETPEELLKNTVKLHTGLNTDQLKGIFKQLLKQNIDSEIHITPHSLQKIAS
jgi:ABC-type lipoprotein export system ATPase subunit